MMSRIKFLFVLIVLLAACTPNATPAPLPTVTSAPVVIETPTIVLPSPTEVLIAPPFKSKDMEALSTSGYKWNEQSGKLTNPSGKEIELPPESAEKVEVVVTNVLDYEGRPLVVLVRVVDGVEEVSLPGGEWEPRMDLSAGRALVDANALANELSFHNWGTYEDITLDAIPVVPRESVVSELLRTSRALGYRPWPADFPEPDWVYMPINSERGIWAITQYRTNNLELDNFNGQATFPGKYPIVWETDGMIPFDIVKYQDASGEWVINTGFQRRYNGSTLIYPVEFTGDFANPNSDRFPLTQMFSNHPSWAFMLPIVTDSSFAPLLPSELHAKIAQFKGKPVVWSDVTGVVPVGKEFFQIQKQKYSRLKYYFESRQMQGYLRDSNDPLFAPKYPPPNP